MDKIKILVVDDESRMRKLVKDFLGREGYQVLEAGDGMEAMEVFYDEKDIALIILDVMMPRMDGWQVCREVRQSSKVPIIMLTARSEERDELQGFALGVDEYISKPFSPKILVARVNAILRRANVLSGGDEIDAGGIVIDKAAHQVKIDGKEIELSFKEFELLSYFVENQGIALSSELGTSRAKYIYELQVELPGNWEKGQKIRVINCLNEKEKEEYKISVAKLVKNKNRIEKYVECEKVSEKGFVIKGWCIYQNKVDIIVKDEKKNILPVKIKEKKRVDVFNQYPECTEEDVYGFEIVYKGNVPKVVYVYLEEGNKSAKYGVTHKASVVKKGVNKVKRYKDKGMIYLKKYGIKDVFERVEMKLSRKNHEMYEYWRRLYVPTKKQLKEQSEQAFEIEPKISIVVPLYKTDQRFLKEMIDSVKGQSYSNRELCLSDGSGNPTPLKDFLTKYENEDKRIKVIRNDFPLQISDNTNKA